MDEMVNLLVDLQQERFGEEALARALRGIEDAGFAASFESPGDDAYLAWIDDVFGGTWSSEAFAGHSFVARKDGTHAGFAAFGASGLQFSWLRGLGREPGVGIFGPFGVDPAFRGSPIGPLLLVAALAGLRRAGYTRALIPAVGHEKLVAYYTNHSGAHVAESFEKARWQGTRYRTVVMASGNGSNFQSVLDASRDGRLPLDVTALVSNRPQAYALERARAENVRALSLTWDRKAQPRAEYDASLLLSVQREQPDLLLLLGWMHVLDDRFIEAFPEAINIHPAFLPLDQARDEVGFPDGSRTPVFRGAKAVADALTWGSGWVGATSHVVTLDADRGPVLVRKPLAIARGETVEEIMQRLHPLEHRVLAGGIMRWVYER